MSTKSVAKRANALIAQTFGVEDENALRECLSDKQRARECKSVVDSKIRDLAQRLATPLDRPSWGPGHKSHKHNADFRHGREIVAEGGKLIPPMQREIIIENLERSERYANFSGLYLLFVVFALLVAASALFVDYQIMTEFWTRALANEFMEVPQSLATSVVSKSLQVVFATVAFHFLLSRLPETGRIIFIALFFVLTFAMVAGFGFLNARMSLPHDLGVATTGAQTGGALSEALSGLGLGESAGAAASAETPAPVSEGSLRQIEWTTWLISPGIVFLIVTGIGALCLHVAETNLQNFVKSRDYNKRKRRIHELDVLERAKATVERYLTEESEIQAPVRTEVPDAADDGKISTFPPRQRL